MAELSKDTKAVVEDALDAADRKALQQAAKAVGVKANGTSVSIIAQLKAWLTTTAAPDASAPPAAPASRARSGAPAAEHVHSSVGIVPRSIYGVFLLCASAGAAGVTWSA